MGVAFCLVDSAACGEAPEMDSHVEKSKEDPIPTRKLLMMVNDYVVNSTRFVNRFHAVCEEKLQKVSRKIGQTVWLTH